jgi:hypothetical protein
LGGAVVDGVTVAVDLCEPFLAFLAEVLPTFVKVTIDDEITGAGSGQTTEAKFTSA